MEILDLLAKISWDTNSKELDALNRKLGEENKLLDELRNKGRNLEAQMLKTNDPKKVAEYNKQLQAVRKSADAITDSQKKQVEVSKQLVTQQQKLHTELRKTNDPNQVKGLLQGLYKVENQMSVLTTKATTMGAKFGGIGQSLLQGFGLGGGVAIGAMALSGISTFFQSALAEAAEAEQGLLKFKQTLDNIGQGGLFDKLVSQADQLAGAYKNLFDNDDIIAGQAKFIEGTKVTEEQLSKLIPVAIELAAKLGTDVTTASEMLVNSIIGRTSPELKRLGLDMKGLGNQTERVNEITGDFATLLSGSVDTALQTSQGKTKQLAQELANLEETIGEKLLPLQKSLAQFKLGLLNNLSTLLSSDKEKYDQELQSRADEFKMQIKGTSKETDQAYLAQQKREKHYIEQAIKGNDLLIKSGEGFVSHEEAKAAKLAKIRNKEYKQELLVRDSRILALTQLRVSDEKGNTAFNPNAGQDEETEIPKAVKKTTKKIQAELNKPQNTVIIRAEIAPINSTTNAPALDGKASSKGVLGSLDYAKEQQDKLIADTKIRDEEKQQAKRDLYSNTLDLARAAQDQIRIEEDKTNRLIALQEKRVDSARNQSSASLKIEQDRLNELVAKRKKYEQAQRAIDAAVITANTALSISNAIAGITSAKGNPLLIAANVVAILAGIGAVIGSIRSINADSGFKEGGYTGDGDPSSESTAIGKRPYKYHKKEFVMNEELTRKHRDLFDGLHNKDLVVNKLDDGKWYITQNGLDNNAMVNDHYSVKNDNSMMPLLYEMQGIKSLLKQREVKVENNFDSDGFGMAVATQMGNITLKNKRRQW